jgi:hypothetical protein
VAVVRIYDAAEARGTIVARRPWEDQEMPPRVLDGIERIFGERFLKLFGDADFSEVRFDKERTLDLVRWLLVKTRNYFIAALETSGNTETVSAAYLADWEFILAVLSDGIYKERGK